MKAKIIVIVISALGFVTSRPAFSQEVGREPTSVIVSTRFVDFKNEKDVEALDGQLYRAAKRACDSGEDRRLAAALEDAKCTAEAWSKAVRNINQPLLSALHAQTLVLAQNR